MNRFRVYLLSTIGGLTGGLTVLGISSYFERQEAQRAIERLSTAPLPQIPEGGGGMVWGGASYGPVCLRFTCRSCCLPRSSSFC